MDDAHPDAELLRRYAHERDEDAFTELVRRYLPMVFHTAARQLDGDDAAQDVAQKVFTLLAQKAGTLAEHEALAGWLHTTTRFVAADVRRAERRRRVREQEAYAMSEQFEETAAETMDWIRLRPVLDEAIADLNADDREAVLLRFFAARPHAEIATRLRVSENAARMRVDRALGRLQGFLARRGITSTSAALALAFAHQASAAVPSGLQASAASAALQAAHASASVCGGGGAFVLMSASKTVWVGAGALLLAVLCGVTVVRVGALRAAEARALAVEAQFAARAAENERFQRTLVALDSEVAALVKQVEANERAQAAAAASRDAAEAVAKAAASWDPLAEGRALMERHPALKRAVIERSDATARYFFLPQLRELGLTPAQIDAFIRIKREESAISAPFGPNGMVYALPAGDGLTPEETKRALRDLLGEENHRKLDDVHRAGEARTMTFSLASMLAFTATPLEGAQAEQFQRLLFNHRLPIRQPRLANFDWDAVMAQAPAILSPPQVAALVRVRAESEERLASVRPMPDMSGKKQPGR